MNKMIIKYLGVLALTAMFLTGAAQAAVYYSFTWEAGTLMPTFEWESGSSHVLTLQASADAAYISTGLSYNLGKWASRPTSTKGYDDTIFDTPSQSGSDALPTLWTSLILSGSPTFEPGYIGFSKAKAPTGTDTFALGISKKRIYDIRFPVKLALGSSTTFISPDSSYLANPNWDNLIFDNQAIPVSSNPVQYDLAIKIAGALPPTFNGVSQAAKRPRGNTLYITWDAAQDLTKPLTYLIRRSTDPAFGSSVVCGVVTTDTFFMDGPDNGIPGIGLNILSDEATYYYRITANDACVPPNPNISVVTKAGTPDDITPPDNVSAQDPTSSDKKLTLTWTNPSLTGTNQDLSGVLIVRREGANPTFVPATRAAYSVGPAPGAPGETIIYNGNATTTTTQDANLTNGTHYYYKWFTYDVQSGIQHGLNYSLGVTKEAAPGVAPSRPWPFSALASDESVLLTWTNPPETYFAGTKIMVSTESYPAGQSLGTLVTNDAVSSSGETKTLLLTRYTTPMVVTGETYYFSAFSYNSSPVYSSVDAHAIGTVETDVTPPGSVVWFRSLAPAKQIVLTWINPSDLGSGEVAIIKRLAAEPTYVPATSETLAAGQSLTADEKVIYVGSVASAIDNDVDWNNQYNYKAFAFDLPRKNYAFPGYTTVRLTAGGGGGTTTIEPVAVSLVNSSGVGTDTFTLGKEDIYAMLVATSENVSTISVESVTIKVQDKNNADEENLVLTETAANSGVFTALTPLAMRYQTSASPVTGDAFLQVDYGDTIRGYYGGSFDEATILSSAVSGRSSMAYADPKDKNVFIIRYTLDADQDTSLIVINSLGQIIWKRAYISGTNGARSAAENLIKWNLIDDYSQQVDNGVYLYRVMTGGGSKTLVSGKMLILR